MASEKPLIDKIQQAKIDIENLNLKPKEQKEKVTMAK
jgi:hypothetical protein